MSSNMTADGWYLPHCHVLVRVYMSYDTNIMPCRQEVQEMLGVTGGVRPEGAPAPLYPPGMSSPAVL